MSSNKTPNLNLPQYKGTDKFDLKEINDSYSIIDNAYKEVIDIKDEITKTNATAEVINARGGKKTLGDRLDEFSSKFDNVEIDVKSLGFQQGKDGDIELNTTLIQSLINEHDDLVLYFPSGINKIGQLNLGVEKNITFKGKSSSFATSTNKSTSNPKIIDTYTQLLINLNENEAWITHQNSTIIFEKISVINGIINNNDINYTNSNLMIKTQANNLKGKVFASESSFIGWKSVCGDIDILSKESDILQSCWLANRCRFRNNKVALAQLVDGRIIDCSFNKNDYAIVMKKGSGFSTIIANRIEWNNEQGIVVNKAHDVTITNNEFDRNGKAGLLVNELLVGNITDNTFRRNGATETLSASDYNDNIHFSIKNCNNVIVKGNNTVAKSTLDTSTGGMTRPSNVSNISNNTNCIISENILNGCSKSDKLSANTIENNTNCVIVNNIPGIT